MNTENMTQEELRQQLLASSVKYCCYCGTEQGSRWHCCEENHFETFAEMDEGQQEDFLDASEEIDQ